MNFKAFEKAVFKGLGTAVQGTKAKVRPVLKKMYDEGITNIDDAIQQYHSFAARFADEAETAVKQEGFLKNNADRLFPGKNAQHYTFLNQNKERLFPGAGTPTHDVFTERNADRLFPGKNVIEHENFFDQNANRLIPGRDAATESETFVNQNLDRLVPGKGATVTESVADLNAMGQATSTVQENIQHEAFIDNEAKRLFPGKGNGSTNLVHPNKTTGPNPNVNAKEISEQAKKDVEFWEKNNPNNTEFKTLDQLSQEKFGKTDIEELSDAYDDLKYSQTPAAKSGAELKEEARQLEIKERDTRRKAFVNQQRQYQDHNNWEGPELTGKIQVDAGQPTYFPPVQGQTAEETVYNVKTGKKTVKPTSTNGKMSFDFQNKDFAKGSENAFFNRSVSRSKDTLNEANEKFAYGAKVALGAVTTFGVLSAALSSSRGQQNNAQLYGQQPIY